MSNLDNMFLRAISAMSGEDNTTSVDKSISMTGLNKESEDMEILDYIVVQLCTCLDTSKMAFHGGYVLNKIIKGELPRGTVDVDVSVDVSEYYDKVVVVLKQIGDNLVGDGVFKSYRLDNVATEECSGGIDLYRLDGSKKRKLGVDVGVRDISHGTVAIQLVGYDAVRFSVERMLSDKLTAIYTEKRFRRTKDLYDFYIITNCYDIDVAVLKKELMIENKIDWSNTPFNQDIAAKYMNAYNTLRIYDGNKIKSVEDVNVSFKDALGRVSLFVDSIDEPVIWKCNRRIFIEKT